MHRVQEYSLLVLLLICTSTALSGTVTDIDGNVYQTVVIGTQEWMAENLKVTHYRNGEAIPNVTDSAAWQTISTGAYCEYNNDVNNVATYGRLYNWFVVDDSRNIAPAGWHVPSDAEWQTLVDYLGGNVVAGGTMKEVGTTHWNSPNTGATNESGFTALPGGRRAGSPDYDQMGVYASFWPSTEYYGNYAWYRSLDFASRAVTRYAYNKQMGLSVRCVKDEHADHTIRILDGTAEHDPIPNRAFEFIKVYNNRPTMSEQLMGSLTTNDLGRVTLPGDWFSRGEMIKVRRLIHIRPAMKHIDLMPYMFYLAVDNAEFDPTSGTISYDTLSSASEQNIYLDHTVVTYDLVVSVEWDADDTYLDSLVSGLRQMSNYLYDVTDGQLYINSVHVLDNKVRWEEADVRIHASNVALTRGDSYLTGDFGQGGGIFGAGDQHLYYPRIFYFSHDGNRNLTYSLFPYRWTLAQTTYGGSIKDYPASRTLAHEFGHYGIGFRDEYEDNNGQRVLGSFEFGLMDDQTKSGIAQNSEMSSDLQYADATHQITEQWIDRGNRSCWDYFEWNYQLTYDDIYAHIEKPTSQMFSGPNDSLQDLDYDVGYRLHADVTNQDNSAFTLTVINKDGLGFPIGNSKVTLFKNNRSRVVEQGNTADNGHIYCLGTNCNDIVRAYARIGLPWFYAEFTVCGSGKSRFSNSYATSADGDSVIVILKEVQGDFRMLNTGRFEGENSFSYEMKSNKQFSQVPALEFYSPDGQVLNYDFLSGTSGYATLISDNLGEAGLFSVLALDDGANELFVNNAYRVTTRYDTFPMPAVVGPEGTCELVLDTVNSLMEKVLVLSSDFPPIMGSIDPGVAQVGGSHSFISYPDMGSLNGTGNHITIRYSEYGLAPGVESSLRVHIWDYMIEEWVLVGGAVDTATNEVFSGVSSLGTYTLFATESESCCIGRVGDANGSNELTDEVTLGDIMLLVDVKFISGDCSKPSCIPEADVNQDGGLSPTCEDHVTLGDIMTLVDFLFITGPETAILPDCL